MKTIEQYKAAAVYFPPGRIVPNWVLRIVKGHKRNKRNIKFGAPVWVLPCGDRLVIFGSTELPGTCLMHFSCVDDIAVDAYPGMHNMLVLNGDEAVTAEIVRNFIERPLAKVRRGNRVKVRGTKLQRRRAKVAAKRERRLSKEVTQFRADIATHRVAQKGQP